MLRVRFQFLRLSLVIALVLALPGKALGLPYVSTDGFIFRPLLTTTDDPANHLVSSPSSFDGVARVVVQYPHGTFQGSGALLQSGGNRFLLTAAHVVNDAGLFPTVLTASFPGQATSYSGLEYHVHPTWTGSLLSGIDLAIVRLNAPVPSQAYDILRTDIIPPPSDS